MVNEQLGHSQKYSFVASARDHFPDGRAYHPKDIGTDVRMTDCNILPA
jgi:hypothetical protein